MPSARRRHFCILLLPGKSMASGGTRPAGFVFKKKHKGKRLTICCPFSLYPGIQRPKQNRRGCPTATSFSLWRQRKRSKRKLGAALGMSGAQRRQPQFRQESNINVYASPAGAEALESLSCYGGLNRLFCFSPFPR